MDDALIMHHTRRALGRMFVHDQDWDDWYQEARLRVWQLEEQGYTAGLLATVLKCDIIDAYRRVHGRRPGQRPYMKGFGELVPSSRQEPMKTLEQVLAETRADEADGPADIAEAKAEVAGQRRVLRRMWTQLPHRDRLVIRRRLQGACFRVIGNEIGLTECGAIYRFKYVCRVARLELAG